MPRQHVEPLAWEAAAVLGIAVLAWLRTVASGLVTVMDVLWGLGFVVIATSPHLVPGFRWHGYRRMEEEGPCARTGHRHVWMAP